MEYMEMVKRLNEASDAYYNKGTEIMSNFEWDAMFDEISRMEKETGYISPDSPTQKVGADETKGKKERHEFSALSLAKTKSVEELVKWAENKPVWLSWKLDGLTLVATYDNGKLAKLLTRGNGTIGTNITHLAAAIRHLPQKIDFTGHIVVRGEALISYKDFERINAEIPDEDGKYANPRNLASGTLNLDDIEEVKNRNVQLCAFSLVHIDGEPDETRYHMDSWGSRMDYLDSIGFCSVKRVLCKDADEISAGIDMFTREVSSFEFPVDGLVICYDDWNYAQTGSVTGHHATRAGFAFKWKDETAETVVTGIDYAVTRTGKISQVAVFDPVELCGTTVSRANIPNLSYRAEKDIKIGDRVSVYKANMIIPQIAENLDRKERNAVIINDIKRYQLPEKCPCCKEPVGVRTSESGIMDIYCNNPFCSAKQLKKFVHFCDRENMNIMGLSEAKLEVLLERGYIRTLSDLYRLQKENGSVCNMDKTRKLENEDGWERKSVENLLTAIEKSRNTDFIRFIAAIGIPNCGHGQAKLLAPEIIRWINENPDSGVTSQDNLVDGLVAMVKSGYDFTSISGIGGVIADSVMAWVQQNFREDKETDISLLLKELNFTDSYEDYIRPVSDSPVTGKTFVITGDVHIFKNRKELQKKIEDLGGKATGSVTGKTSFLINNDVTSESGKNKKAKELGIPIISEEEFCRMAGIEV